MTRRPGRRVNTTHGPITILSISSDVDSTTHSALVDHAARVLAGRRILVPARPPLWPSLDALAWHRRAVFMSR